ncbi:MYG1 protein-like protein [Rhizodiscina lignyota]|uniref:MYG1 protein-like protein n=1 Tax=Rhizodiscina lignyota TaxID=1504668 RepID=A0A9P4M7L2_9PEZI|nr:MYG1 protein-like protein [Rhizodiscina lignyota]
MSDLAPTSKRQKLSGPLIGTHNGHFHADEALAVYLLRLLPTYSSSPLVRTRDPAQLSTCHTVVDVGAEYDSGKLRFDHHQREFNSIFPNRSTKLSSAGLVYLHFGKQVISQITGLDEQSNDVSVLWDKLYESLIEAFDANDNGIDVYDPSALKSAGLEKRFENRGFSIASVVNRYNWHHGEEEAEKAKSKEQLQQEEDERFEKASQFTGEQFIMELQDKHRSWLPARAIVHEAYASRHKYHPSGQIMVLPFRQGGVPWADHLYTLEASTASAANGGADASSYQVLYVLFPEDGTPESKWRIRAVSMEGGGFQNRKDMPDAWKGLRDEKLSEVSGVEGGVFVHASGFIGGNKTFEGALEMAKKAVET